MFYGLTAFNQDISSWDVGSGTAFVSGSGLWESWSSRCFWLLSSTTVAVVAVLEGVLYCSSIRYYNHAHRHHQTKILTHFFRLSNIATTHRQQHYGTTPPAFTGEHVSTGIGFQPRHF